MDTRVRWDLRALHRNYCSNNPSRLLSSLTSAVIFEYTYAMLRDD